MRTQRWAKSFVMASLIIILLWVAVICGFAAVTTKKLPVPVAQTQTAIPTATRSVSGEDVTTVLFGASSIALILFSLIAAWAAVVGWQGLKDQVRKEIEASTQKRIDALEMEVRGRLSSAVGHTLGLLSTRSYEWEPRDPDQLREAVQQCQRGYEILEPLGEKAKFMALNNLVYYSAILGGNARSHWLMEQARLLRAAGQEHNSARLLLSYCRAALRYAADDVGELGKARQIAAALADSGEGSDEERREAKFYLGLLNERMK